MKTIKYYLIKLILVFTPNTYDRKLNIKRCVEDEDYEYPSDDLSEFHQECRNYYVHHCTVNQRLKMLVSNTTQEEIDLFK